MTDRFYVRGNSTYIIRSNQNILWMLNVNYKKLFAGKLPCADLHIHSYKANPSYKRILLHSNVSFGDKAAL